MLIFHKENVCFANHYFLRLARKATVLSWENSFSGIFGRFRFGVPQKFDFGETSKRIHLVFSKKALFLDGGDSVSGVPPKVRFWQTHISAMENCFFQVSFRASQEIPEFWLGALGV